MGLRNTTEVRTLSTARPRGHAAPAQTTAQWLLAALERLGVERAFGLVGGAIAPLAHALAHSGLQTHHFRHECGAGYAALEAALASGRPTLVYVTTGPGLTNVLTAVSAARWEGAKLVLLSGATPAAQRQRWACQETSSLTLPLSGLFTPGPLFHQAAVVESPRELESMLARMALGFARPGAYLAHLALPLALQSAPAPERPFGATLTPSISAVGADTLQAVAQALTREECVLWVGFGARGAAPKVRALAERLGAPVMCSPRAKGVFPEDHPLYLGTTGLGGHPDVERHFEQRRPAHVLVLGSRLSEPTSFWNPLFVPTGSFIHVDVDPEVPGAAFPEASTWAVQAEVGAFLDALLAALPAGGGRARPPVRALPPAAPVLPRAEGPVRPQAVMAALQRVVVDGSDAVVMTESGNAFAWGNQLLRFGEPHRYRVSTGYGAMAHFATGVVGTALATGRKAVAVVGDGAMLMGTELHSAVQYRAKAVWVVLNDARYNMVEQGMRALGYTPLETAMPPVDFRAMARACGAAGVRVTREEELVHALEAALAASGPFVVDVETDPRETAPWMRRIQNLIVQGADGAPHGDNR
ncbi:MAG: thiamine pyrophosphate-dependent enzyme [Myxococcaceae bacterium]|nr:thiamine pyrophosphate-dependent enzyme [Myxococcaceae bacterium]MCI0672635.1 thiamine pyrophosphate-dependent enzyme [Myxococcaceae bacterium]